MSGQKVDFAKLRSELQPESKMEEPGIDNELLVDDINTMAQRKI